jgi:uncharacterized protein YbbC (DUF1343 family)
MGRTIRLPEGVITGLDSFEKVWPRDLRGARAGLLVHPASVNGRLQHAADVFMRSKKCELKAFFGPQHGIRGETQDNMIEWEGFTDRKTGLPVYSLYGKTRQPEPAMLNDIDLIVIDMQDVGARYYTFIWTMALVMKACEAEGKKAVVLDRPNPIGGRLVEGPVLRQQFRSFVGLHPLPARHGMTIGEISLYLRDSFYPLLDLHVMPMKGWKREMWFEDTGLPWVLPSPNMPTADTAAVYPGMCLLEGTNISEGRGTTRPFEIFGAPFVDPDLFVRQINKLKLGGVIFRPLSFLPTFQKHAGSLCGGAQIHVTNRKTFRPFKTAVAVIRVLSELYPDHFSWKKPPYEYEEVLPPIDILAGTDRLRRDIQKGVSLKTMEDRWAEESAEFDHKVRKKYLLYR